MSPRPTELTLTLAPQRRFEAIDVNRRIADEAGDVLRRHRRALYCSFHTTAGYLDQSLSARMHHRQDLLSQFFRAFHALFPQGGEYHHDHMELRSELTDEQKVVEPRNADSHLTYIGVGDAQLRHLPIASGCAGLLHRARRHDRRDAAASATTKWSPTTTNGSSRDVDPDAGLEAPVDSINLADPRLGLLETRSTSCSQKGGLEHGRVDLVVDPTERNVGLTVNEYETLLMQNDLAEVLRDPLRFARIKARNMHQRPAGDSRQDAELRQVRRRPRAQFADGSAAARPGSFERLVAKVMSLPARRFLRSRRVSFLAAGEGAEGARLQRGTYQSPILVQWQSPERKERRVDIVLSELS